jgi:hypothetical protein
MIGGGHLIRESDRQALATPQYGSMNEVPAKIACRRSHTKTAWSNDAASGI